MTVQIDERTIRRVLMASAVGTVIEWYDFTLYGAASALIFAPLFFPGQSPLLGTLASFATFAVGFFVRPLGGLVVAHFGDRVGRKPMLIFTVALMGISTMLIGLLPTHASIGVWAPLLLVLMRVLQGFGAGAEYAGAVTLVAEYAPRHKRALYTSASQAATALSLVLAMGVFTLLATMPRDQLLSWGWRVAFLASFVIFFVAIFIRRRLGETPEFILEKANQQRELHKQQGPPLLQAFRESRREMILGLLSITGHNANVYLLNTFALSYITNTLALPQSVAITALLLAACVGVVTVPLFGHLADRVGRRPVFMGGAAFVAVFAFPFFWMLDTRATPVIALAMILGYGIGFAAMAGSQAAFLSELFETRYRYTGIAGARELNAMLVAGPTPFIAIALVAAGGGTPWLVALYLIGCQLVTILALYLVRTASRQDRSATAPSI